MTQVDLLSWAPPHVSGSETSRLAGESIRKAMPTLRERVLSLLKANPGGLIDEEISDLLAMSPSTQRPRRCELAELGLIERAGFTRKTRSGRSAEVWRAR